MDSTTVLEDVKNLLLRIKTIEETALKLSLQRDLKQEKLNNLLKRLEDLNLSPESLPEAIDKLTSEVSKTSEELEKEIEKMEELLDNNDKL